MLEKVSSDLLQEILETLKSTKGFVLEQAPDIVQQFYKWKVAEHIFYVILALIISGVMISLACKYWECVTKDDNAGPVVAGIVGLVAMGVALGNVFNLIQIYVAPKIYLIEYITELLKSK